MGQPPTTRAVGLVVLVVACVTVSVADDLPPCSGSVSLSVTPPQPGCDDVVTLGATQFLNDTCWTAEAPIFSDEPPDYLFEMASIDRWDEMPGCSTMIVEIPFTRQVGPLPAGPYSLGVYHTSTSPRHGDSACAQWIPFEVTCCAELPSEATSMQVGTTGPGAEIWLNWDDAAGAADYVVFGADEPDGPFTRQIQTAPSGVVGVGVAIEEAPSFFVVAARNDCGVGPRH
jgi:hypothetical protein